MSLRAKWSLLFFVLAVVPIALLAPVALRVQRAGLERAEKELETAVVDEASRSMERELDDAALATHRTGAILTDARIGEDDGRLAVARDVVANARALEYVAIYAPDGSFIDAIRRSSKTVIDPPKQVPEAARDDALGRWIATGGKLDLAYVEPLVADHERRGYISGALAPERLTEQLGALGETRFGRADRIYLVDADLVVVAAPGAHELVGQSMRGRDVFTHVSAPGQGVALTTEFAGDGGEEMVGTVRSVPVQGWAIVVRRPVSEAFGALTASRSAFLSAAAIAALVAVGLAALFASRTTKPIRALVELTRAYGRREFDKKSPVASRNDELGELGKSMKEMADDLVKGEVEIARRAAVETSLGRYLPEPIAKAIAEGTRSLKLGGDRCQITIVFADVAAFTAFAESASPEHVVAFLNELFTILSEVVFRHGGMVDKFLGDCVMALFGADGESPDNARAAASAAEDMQRFVEANAADWKTRFGIDARLGIGVARGEVIVGNLGSDVRMEFTAIGDAVNVASRLEALARPGQTLATRDVVEAAGEGFSFTSLGEHPIRGKQHAVEIFALEVD